MMGTWGGYDGGMMGGYGGGGTFFLLAGLTWVVWLVVGVLLAVWLWKQIKK